MEFRRTRTASQVQSTSVGDSVPSRRQTCGLPVTPESVLRAIANFTILFINVYKQFPDGNVALARGEPSPDHPSGVGSSLD